MYTLFSFFFTKLSSIIGRASGCIYASVSVTTPTVHGSDCSREQCRVRTIIRKSKTETLDNLDDG